jgi:hypothetical protein
MVMVGASPKPPVTPMSSAVHARPVDGLAVFPPVAAAALVVAAASVPELSSEPQAPSANAAAAMVAIPMILAEVGMPRTLIDVTVRSCRRPQTKRRAPAVRPNCARSTGPTPDTAGSLTGNLHPVRGTNVRRVADGTADRFRR